METLLGIIFCIVIAVVVVRKMSASSRDQDNESRYKQKFNAAEAWLRQRLEAAENGQQIEMICGPSSLGFDSDESVVFVLPGVRLLEPRAIRRSRSNYGGPTIRLAKGLSFRLGAGTSQSESSDELREIDQGTLVLTTNRLAFMGSMRTSSVKLDDIIGMEAYTDGIQVHRERKQRAETYVLGQPLQIVEGSGQGLTVFGNMVRASILVAKILHQDRVKTLAAA